MQPRFPSNELVSEFGAALRPRIAGDLRTDRMTRALYSTDASLYRMLPLAVLVPRSRDDVQAALEEAARYGIPVLPRGGGSSLAGQTVGAALVIDFTKHLDQVLEHNVEEETVRVEPGLVLDALNGRLSAAGVMVGPDPASSNRATVGGIVGNNATGTHSILYGSIVDHIVSARAYLADGTDVRFEPLDAAAWAARARRGGSEGRLFEGLDRLLRDREETIRRDTPRHWRRSGGYRLERLFDPVRNPAELLCGSEGTLAVLSEVTLRTVARPRMTALGIVHYHSRMESLEGVPTLLETNPSAIELFDRFGLDQCRRVPGFAARMDFVEGDPDALLIVEYYGESENELKDKLRTLDAVLQRHRIGYANVHVYDPAAIANVWGIRKEGLGLMMGIRGDHKAVPFIEDAAVPVEHLPAYIGGLEQLFAELKVRWLMYAHASAGCLHVRPFLNMKDAADVAKLEVISTRAGEMVRGFGGTLSSEHGEGLARSWLSESFYGPDLYAAYRETKRLFDPGASLNPGKITDAPPMTQHLRISPDYRIVPRTDNLDFGSDGGFGALVEVCTGVGTCRKSTGQMCPSFMATREEEHSTRGRANALREALSGALGPDAFTSPRMKEVMDLCISCKGCLAECPSAVDMAKLKMEWQDAYWKAHRMPLRERLFAHLPVLSRRFSGRLAGIVNAANRSRPVRALVNRSLGLAADRRLPEFARVPFPRWFASRGERVGKPDLILFHDTFNSYHKTDAAIAAVRFFEAAGLRVRLGSHGCCGRTCMSKGLVDAARAHARRTVEALCDEASEGLPIVGLEPSCVLSLRDEYASLLPDDHRVASVAARAFTFEEYVARLAAEGRLDGLRWRAEPRPVLVHGHCHQKAIGGMGSTLKALSLPGHAVSLIDSSCCGMAGSFGYEAEHVGWSIAMAERTLAPAVRNAGKDTVIVAAGFSCRAQIEHVAGRPAMHPAELLAMSLV